MKLTFEQWMKAVDQKIENQIGLSHADLPDICYRELYDDGVSPASAVRQAIKGFYE